MEHALARFRFVYERYLQGTDAKIYFAAIPDKNYFLAEQYGYPALDYEEFIQKFADGMEYAQTVGLTDVLTLGSYYRTDIHWRQEAILPVAQRLAEAMGVELNGSYETVTLDAPFCGVYCGQSALDLAPDALTYLTNDTLRPARSTTMRRIQRCRSTIWMQRAGTTPMRSSSPGRNRC